MHISNFAIYFVLQAIHVDSNEKKSGILYNLEWDRFTNVVQMNIIKNFVTELSISRRGGSLIS